MLLLLLLLLLMLLLLHHLLCKTSRGRDVAVADRICDLARKNQQAKKAWNKSRAACSGTSLKKFLAQPGLAALESHPLKASARVLGSNTYHQLLQGTSLARG